MSSKNLSVEVDGLSKRYVISHQEQHRYLSTALMDRLRRPFAKPEVEEFWAVKDVSFEVEAGEVLAVIGRNGAGKSTMLKLLSQITEPTEGEIRMHGRVASLLEVGTGFHPELTGRENVFLNGTILGMRKREVQARFDEIVDFAEIERFIDTPVKRYSSGMYVRLAFAVAAHLQPEILIVDEVLAVGDAQFQAKCLGKMQDIAQGHGRTILFVSHNMAAVRNLCTKAAMLKGGRLEYFGGVDQAIALYGSRSEATTGTILGNAIIESEGIVLDSVTVNGSDANNQIVGSGQTTMDIVVRGQASRALPAGLEIKLSNSDGEPFGASGEAFQSRKTPITEAGPFEWHARLELPRNMNAGDYILSIDIAEFGSHFWVHNAEAVRFHYDGMIGDTGEPFLYRYSGLLWLETKVSRSSPVSS